MKFEVPSPKGGRERLGFTLVEVTISGSLMAMILVSGYLCLNAALSSQKLIEPRVEIFQSARVAMALMAADLRNACPLSKEVDFLGMSRMLGEVEADNLDFATHNYTPRRPHEGDYCQMSYFLDKDPESGLLSLYRRRNPRIAPDPLSGGSKEELAKGLVGLRFEYYDGLDWYDSWGDAEGRGKVQNSRRERYNLEGLPEAVRITLWFEANPRAKEKEPVETAKPEKAVSEPPLVFQTVARLNLATSAWRNAASGSGSGTGDSSGGPGAGRNP